MKNDEFLDKVDELDYGLSCCELSSTNKESLSKLIDIAIRAKAWAEEELDNERRKYLN